MVAQHVHHADRRQANGEQVGALHFAGTHQQSAVRAAGDGQLFTRGILLGDEEFGRRDEIVEDLLLAVEHTSLVPPLAVFRTAAQVDVHHHAALLHEEDVLGLERRGDIDLETAVAVEVTGIAAVEPQPPAMRDEHRHVLAVGGFEEELFGSVLRRIVGHLRRMVAGSAARGDVVAVDGRRRGEGVEREENLLLPVLAAETRHRTDGRQRHVGLPVALVIVFVDLVLRVPEVFHPQVSPARSDRFEQIVGVLRDDGLQPPGFEQIDARQPIVGRTVVGHDIEFVVAALDGRIVVGEAGQQRTERLLLVRRAEENFTARRTFRREDEKPAAVVALPAAEIAQRMLRIAVYENVVGLRRTQTVVIDLLAFVLRRIDVRLRRVVGAVIEPLDRKSTRLNSSHRT